MNTIKSVKTAVIVAAVVVVAGCVPPPTEFSKEPYISDISDSKVEVVYEMRGVDSYNAYLGVPIIGSPNLIPESAVDKVASDGCKNFDGKSAESLSVFYKEGGRVKHFLFVCKDL